MIGVRKPDTGFTLIELIMVISVLSVVSTLCVTAFIGLTRYWDDTHAMTELSGQADDAIASIRDDLNRALSLDVSGVPLQGVPNDYRDSSRFFDWEMADDRIVIPALVRDMAGSETPRSVMYRIDREGSRDKLVRTVGDLGTETPSSGRFEVIPRADVIRFRLEYASDDGGWRWQPRWGRARSLPRAVRVSLALADPNRPDRQIARKAVLPIRVH